MKVRIFKAKKGISEFSQDWPEFNTKKLNTKELKAYYKLIHKSGLNLLFFGSWSGKIK